MPRYIRPVGVTNIIRRPCNRPVYNIAVDGDESYIAENIVVHNCRSLLVPVTKFEDVEFDEPVPLDELKEMGAGFIYEELPMSIERVQMPIVNPTIMVSGEVARAGDTIVIAPSGPMTFVKVLSMAFSNADAEHPVVVGTRHDYYEPLKNEAMLPKQGGRLEKQFPEGWIFPENKGMFINLSANALVKWTIEYIIVDVNGVRIR